MSPSPTLFIRNVPSDVYERLEACAARNGRSVSAEALAIITAAVRCDDPGKEATTTDSE